MNTGPKCLKLAGIVHNGGQVLLLTKEKKIAENILSFSINPSPENLVELPYLQRPILKVLVGLFS